VLLLRSRRLVSNSSDELRAILSCRNSVKHILETINPEETSYRFSEVESAYDSTLNWLFEESKVHLSLWLRSGEGFFGSAASQAPENPQL
jgi:hypothetical protein